ncbi:PfkB family carbohydrate kinase [Pseudomonas sp. OIL-1]|uniref:PfkB family carbohydrate kinase n=1 Tax=Pseudomonas sp. OIL-1 TaxID=2706126 RepID=UPI0013A758FE|nr:PfkB family carbohydrate kinase [Pseudomonas sp. OIL-1]QIB49849.1 ribokinase [Pseudomonas sp. OIL-1]
MKSRTMLSLGSINADFQVRVNAAIGSNDMLPAHDFCRLSGGKAANTAFLAARFGHASRLLGCVGDDDLAQQALGSLAAAGVDLDGVNRVTGQPTGVSMIMVPPDAKKHIVLAPNANDCWDDAAAVKVEAAIGDANPPACLVLDCEIPAWVVRRAIQKAAASDIPVILDPSFVDRVEPAVLNRLHAITPNISEAGGLVGRDLKTISDAAGAARQLRNEGVELVCIKLGDGGCVLAAGSELIHIPAGEIDPVDSTGAGDAFTGVFSVALLEGMSALDAAAWGVASANLAVTGYGSQPAYADREEIVQMAARLSQDARVLHV